MYVKTKNDRARHSLIYLKSQLRAQVGLEAKHACRKSHVPWCLLSNKNQIISGGMNANCENSFYYVPHQELYYSYFLSTRSDN